MRLASLDRDFWHLRSAEASHRHHEDTFEIPTLAERRALSRGKAARLIFDIECEDEAGTVFVQGERIWVVVAEVVGDTYVGILDGQPVSVEPAENVFLVFGAEIPFRAEHVIEIGDPPSGYVDWQLSQPPERFWPRDD